MYIIETKDITKKYGKYQVLNKLNIHVKENSIYGLIGKNGAGKTTLIRIICGLQDPTNGIYFINKIDNKAKDISLVRKKIGAIIERPSIYEEMNAKDNIICQMKLVGLTNYQDVSKFLDVVGLSNVGNKKVRYYSLGMKQRLGIALALVNNPNILILDEPINGLDPEGIIEIRELILKLNKEKHITILISSHYLDELSKVATHYGFIDKGRIIEEISSEELKEILNHVTKQVIVQAFGMACCFYSRRELVTNYFKFKNKKPLNFRGKLGNLQEETRESEYHLVEDINGVRIFEEKHYYLAEELDDMINVSSLLISHFDIKNKDYLKIVSLYSDYVTKHLDSSILNDELNKLGIPLYKGAYQNKTVLLKAGVKNE